MKLFINCSTKHGILLCRTLEEAMNYPNSYIKLDMHNSSNNLYQVSRAVIDIAEAEFSQFCACTDDNGNFLEVTKMYKGQYLNTLGLDTEIINDVMNEPNSAKYIDEFACGTVKLRVENIIGDISELLIDNPNILNKVFEKIGTIDKGYRLNLTGINAGDNTFAFNIYMPEVVKEVTLKITDSEGELVSAQLFDNTDDLIPVLSDIALNATYNPIKEALNLLIKVTGGQNDYVEFSLGNTVRGAALIRELVNFFSTVKTK